MKKFLQLLKSIKKKQVATAEEISELKSLFNGLDAEEKDLIKDDYSVVNKLSKYQIGRKVRMLSNIKVKKIDEEKFKLDAIFSTANEDRHGDIVKQNFVLKDFKKNPVVLNSHNYHDAEEVIGRATNVKVVDGKLEGSIEFAVNENPKAKVIFDLYKGGFLNAFSIGFIPLEFNKDYDILKSELLEVSAVSVPANAQALAKQKGIDIDKLYANNDKNSKNKKNDGNSKSGGDSNKDRGKKDNEKDKGSAGDGKSKNQPKNKEFENWEDGTDEIRLKLRDITEFESGTFRKEVVQSQMPKVNGISAVLAGTEKRVFQSLQFPKSEGWTMDDAKKWFSVREADLMEKIFEIGKDVKSDVEMAIKNLANKHDDLVNKGLTKVAKAVEVIATASKYAKFADDEKRRETKAKINKVAKNILKLK